MAESKPLTPTERRVLVATLYQAGHTTRQIAEQLGVSYQAIQQMLQRLDIPRRPRGGNMGSHSRRRK
jgi:DNA-binding MarR family transcriptional regulator